MFSTLSKKNREKILLEAKRQLYKNTVEFQTICDPSVISELERMGHNKFELAVIANSMNAVQMDQTTGLLTAATCWRGDGQPAGLSGAFAKHRDDWFG